MEKEEILKEIIKIIRQYLSSDYRILLFGSWAKNTAVETSDLDIAIDGPEKVSQEVMIKIKAGIEGIMTLRKVDVVDLNSVGEEFKKNILDHAQIIDQ